MSAFLSWLNVNNAREQTANALKEATAQAANAERSRKAAENTAEAAQQLARAAVNSAAAAQELADIAHRSLATSERGTKAAENSSRAADRLALEMKRSAAAGEALTLAVTRGQAAYLTVSIEPNDNPTGNSWSRTNRLIVKNETKNPAINIDVAYEVRTLLDGNLWSEGFAWLTGPSPASNQGVAPGIHKLRKPVATLEDYVQAINKLSPRANIAALGPDDRQVALTFSSPVWFSFTKKGTDRSRTEPTAIAASQSAFRLQPAVVLGYVSYIDITNNPQRVDFCYQLDSQEKLTNCAAANTRHIFGPGESTRR